MKLTSTIVRKSININQTLERQVQREADKIGFSFGEYVRYTLAKSLEKNDIQNHSDLGTIPLELEKHWAEETDKVIEQVRKGNRKAYTSFKEYMKALDVK